MGDPPVPYYAHLIDRAGRSRYVEYHDLAIDRIRLVDTGAVFVRADPPEVDDLGLPIFQHERRLLTLPIRGRDRRRRDPPLPLALR